MFTLVNTWTGYHRGKPRVLREAVLITQLRLLFHFLEGKRDAASPLKCSTPEGILHSSFPCRQQPTAHAVSGGTWVAPFRWTPQWGKPMPAVQTAAFSRCSIALHFTSERNIPRGQAEARKIVKDSIYLLSMIFSLQKSPELIVCQFTPLHL